MKEKHKSYSIYEAGEQDKKESGTKRGPGTKPSP